MSTILDRSRFIVLALALSIVFALIAIVSASPAAAKGSSTVQRWGSSMATYQCPSGLPGDLASDQTALTYFTKCMQALAVARATYSKGGPSATHREALQLYQRAVRWLAPRVAIAERKVAADDAYWRSVMEAETQKMRDRLYASNPVPIPGVTTDEELVDSLREAASCALPAIAAIPLSRFRSMSKSKVAQEAFQPCLNAIDGVLKRHNFPVSGTYLWRAVFGSGNLNQW